MAHNSWQTVVRYSVLISSKYLNMWKPVMKSFIYFNNVIISITHIETILIVANISHE